MATQIQSASLPVGHAPFSRIHRVLNTARHELWLRVFMVIVLAHWAEHLAQAYQIYALGWPALEARGVLGLWIPWLVSSELLHYTYAIIMLVGIWILRPGFAGQSRNWWSVALALQFWHHIEHLTLLAQAIIGRNLLDRPVPTSLVQIWIPRVELHLFYNAVVFIPMMIAMYHHMFPRDVDRSLMHCTCAVRSRLSAVS